MWIELSITAPAVFQDALSNILFEEGASGTEEERLSIEDSIITLKAYFPEKDFKSSVRNIRKRLQSVCKRGNKASKKVKIAFQSIESMDWGLEWKKHFKPVRIGKTFIILPPWNKKNKTNKEWNKKYHNRRIVIIINPGQGFGTGTHESTKICLKLIEEISAMTESAKLKKFLDIGTGSGILSIAAAKSGFKSCKGIDIDPEAVNNAEENIILNRLKSKISLHVLSPFDLGGEYFDAVAANMILSEHIGICSCYKNIVKTNGLLAVSGLVEGQEKELLSHPEISNHFKKIKTKSCGEWKGLLLKRTETKNKNVTKKQT
ncbi:MAG: 50S ribosomal protein L11 methyltransferase [Candidatus Schekmanbacteria bacterium]|nr:50S ribosomal protein L11 methyltransferase [Candidatus Schekmanbacteria bacterium]